MSPLLSAASSSLTGLACYISRRDALCSRTNPIICLGGVGGQQRGTHVHCSRGRPRRPTLLRRHRFLSTTRSCIRCNGRRVHVCCTCKRPSDHLSRLLAVVKDVGGGLLLRRVVYAPLRRLRRWVCSGGRASSTFSASTFHAD